MLLQLSHFFRIIIIGQLHILAVKQSFLFALNVVSVHISSNSVRELHVLFVQGHSLGVDAAKVGVLKHAHHVGFGGFLKGGQGVGGESEVGVDDLCNLADKSREWRSREDELVSLLVLLDLSKGHGARLESDLSLLTVLAGGGFLGLGLHVLLGLGGDLV